MSSLYRRPSCCEQRRQGNIPIGQSYGVFISQLIRYSRCCQNLKDFKERTSNLVDRLKKQGFKFVKLCQTFTKFAKRYPHLLKKYRDFNIYDLDILLRSGDGKKHYQLRSKVYHFNVLSFLVFSIF